MSTPTIDTPTTDTASLAEALSALEPAAIDTLISALTGLRGDGPAEALEPEPDFMPFASWTDFQQVDPNEAANDAEFWASLPARIEAETATITQNIADGKVFVHTGENNSNGVIHNVDCGRLPVWVDDRPAAWREFEEVVQRDGRAGWYLQWRWPRMPIMLTADEVNELPVYNTCERCDTSALVSQRKRRLFSVKPTPFLSLSRNHVGRLFADLDGSVIGRSVSVTLLPDAAVLTFEDGTVITGGQERSLIMIPAKMEQFALTGRETQ